MKVVYNRSAEKEILSLEKILAQRIARKIVDLQLDPYPHGYEKLSGEGGYRIRIGDYRVVYLIDKKSKVLTITKIKHRREVYR